LLCALPSLSVAQNPSEAEPLVPTSDEEDSRLPRHSDAERLFFDSVNRERATENLGPVKWDEALALAARRHASLMAKEENLVHQLPGELQLDQRCARAGARFSRVGENIAVGPEIETIHTGWMHSPGHRANILEPRFTALGVGVVEVKGELYAVEDFSTAVEKLSIDAQEAKVRALLTAKGVRVTGETQLARKVCADDRAKPAKMSMLILQYETADLTTLPEPVERSIRASRYGRAAVAACTPKPDESGIPRFRIAVVLF
jgi:uncharacterized protein YkwD